MVTIVAVLALLFGAVAIARDAGTPTPDPSVVAEVSDATNGATVDLGGSSGFGAPAAQIGHGHFPNFICHLLGSLAHAFAGFLSGIFNQLLVFFGCIS